MGSVTHLAAHLEDADVEPFSILYRIVGSVTNPKQAPQSRQQVFQYPLSDRGLCNVSKLIRYEGHQELSVSSIGSWAL